MVFLTITLLTMPWLAMVGHGRIPPTFGTRLGNVQDWLVKNSQQYPHGVLHRTELPWKRPDGHHYKHNRRTAGSIQEPPAQVYEDTNRTHDEMAGFIER